MIAALRSQKHSKYMTIALLLLVTLLGVFPLDVILPAFPSLSAHLSVDSTQIALSISLFALVAAVAQLIVGPLSDQVGRRRLLLGGLALSFIGALGCILTNHYPTFLAFRTLQALGCGCFVLSQALIQDVFSAEQRNGLRILLTTASGLFISISPLLGSWLQKYFDWKASFVVFALLASIVWLMCLTLLRKDERSMTSAVDLLGVYRLLCQDMRFLRLCLLAAVAFSCHFTFIVVSPLLFMEQMELSAEHFALVFLLYGVAYLFAGLAVYQLNTWVRPELQMSVGLGLIAISGTTLLIEWQTPTPVSVLIPVITATLGTTLIRPTATTCALALHPNQAGSAAALLNTVVFAAGALASGVISHFGDQLPEGLGIAFLLLAVTGALLLAPQFLHRRIGEEG